MAEAGTTRVSVFLRDDQLEKLRALQKEQGISVQFMIRRGVDLVLAEHAKKGGKR